MGGRVMVGGGGVMILAGHSSQAGALVRTLGHTLSLSLSLSLSPATAAASHNGHCCSGHYSHPETLY